MKFLYAFLLITPLLSGLTSTANAQWIRQYPLEKLEQVLDISVQSDGFGFAVGGDDMVLRLDPNNKTWDLLNTMDLDWTLEAVDYLDGTNGNVVAAGGQGLIVSFNAGQTWTQVPDAPGGIHGIKILSMTELIVAGAEGVFKYENNGWTDLNLPVTSGVAGSHILDGQHIWCFTNGTDPVMYYTSNGGGMWNMNTQIDRPDVVRFYDSQNGISLDSRKVFKSTNGGQTWTEVSNNAIHNSVNDITFGSSVNVLMAATFNGDPAYSNDGGLTWEQQEMGLVIQRNHSVASQSDEHFWMGNDISSIGLTTDAGASWIESSGPDRQLLYDVFFLNRNDGFAVGSKGTLLRTTTGGAQWEDVSFDPSRTYWSVHGTSVNDMWIGASQRILHSDDGGDSWQEKGIFIGGNFSDILAINANLVLATSTSGVILRTDNAGTTWDTVFQTNNQIRSIARIDDQRYMATGFNGLILRSEDQGLTWNPLTAPEAGLQYEQSYFLDNDGWLVTSSFKKTMWHTTNAGDTWDPITLPIDRAWDGVFFMSPDTGIVVAHSNQEGRVYITFNGGMNWQSGYITDFPMYGVAGIPSPSGTAWIFGYGSDIEVLPYCDLLPVIADLTGDFFPCENDTVTYSVTSQNVDAFFWLFPTGWQLLGNANNDTVTVIVGRNAGPISITGSNACGFTSPINMGAGPILLPTLSNLTGDSAPCESELTSYSVTSASVNDFIWSFPGMDWQIFGSSNTDEIQVFAGESAGTIIVTGTNSCGEAQTELEVAPALRPRMHGVSGETAPCEGELVDYTADVEFQDEVIWTYPADWQVSGPSNEASILLMAGVATGKVTATGVNACGMSATQELDAAPIDVPDVTVIVNDDQLSLSMDGVTYQWYLNGAPISGATTAVYTATVSGDYYAVISLPDGCFATSNVVTVMISSVGNHVRLSNIKIYPSPAVDEMRIAGLTGLAGYEVLDPGGRVLSTGEVRDERIDVSALASGMYMLRLYTEEGTGTVRFVVMK